MIAKIWKQYFSLFTLFLVCIPSKSQNIDSLIKTLPTVNSTEKVDVLLKLSHYYMGRNSDSLLFYGEKAYALSKQLQFDTGMLNSMNLIATSKFYKGDYKNAVLSYKEALKLANTLKDSLNMGAILNNLGSCYTYMSEYDNSIKMLTRAREIRILTKDKRLSSTINNLGNAYNRMLDLDKALEYFKEAARLKEENNQLRSLSNTLNNIGIILKNQGNYEDALEYYEKSLKIAIDFEDIAKQAYAHNNISVLYENMDNYKLSEYHAKKSIELKTELGDKGTLINSYNNYGSLLIKLKKYNDAEIAFDVADSLNQIVGKTIYNVYGLKGRAKLYEAMGNYKKSIELLREAMRMSSEEITKERNDKIASLEVEFETAQKEAEIERLALETKFKEIELAKSKEQLFLSILIGLLIITTLIVIYILQKKKSAAEKIANENQIDALKLRLSELQATQNQPIDLDLEKINMKIMTPLTEREYDTLKLMLEGHSNKEIGEQLFVSVNTIKYHLKNIYEKLGVGNRKEVMEFAIQHS